MMLRQGLILYELIWSREMMTPWKICQINRQRSRVFVDGNFDYIQLLFKRLQFLFIFVLILIHLQQYIYKISCKYTAEDE
jgi:hypothetical protein